MLSLISLILSAALAVHAQYPPEINPFNFNPGNNAALCLTAASNTSNAIVTAATCNNGAGQKWSFIRSTNQVQVFGNKCLNVPGGNGTNGVKLEIVTCSSSSANQRFTFNFWIDRLQWLNKNKCLDTSNALANGSRAQIWDCKSGNPNQIWHPGFRYNALPNKTQNGQYGINNCGTSSSQSSKCQTAWINDVDDFCLWAPPYVGNIGDTERVGVAWCTKSGRGTRTIPNGTLKGIHFVKTPDYVQITGVGDFTKLNIPRGDSGGEFDPHGADGNGNPIGGLVYGNSFGSNLQYHEWNSFISYNEVCFKACTGPNAAKHCEHIYDVMGCYWNMPGNYGSSGANKFESCKGENALFPGIYGTSTFHQGDGRTPAPHPAPRSSSCRTVPTISVSPLQKRRDWKRAPVAEPGPTAAPKVSFD